MRAPLLLGTVCGVGILVIVRSVRARPPNLASALHALDQPRGTGGVTRLDTAGLGAAMTRWTPTRVRAADLVLAGRTPQDHAVRVLGTAVVLAAIPLLAAVGATLGGLTVGPAIVVVASTVLAALGLVVPGLEIRGIARARREAFVHALSSFLDVTAVLLAGGAGTETALHAAAALGDHWPQRQLRAALDRCRLTGQTPWEALAELGDRLEVDELSQLATSLQLAGEQGARVRVTLTERARALRASQLAHVEARARAVTEQMSVPVALLAVAFMLFVGFPAVWVVLGEL